MERWNLRSENGFALGADFPEALAEGDWDAVFLCTPNNPTGQLIAPDLLEDICRVCKDRGIRLFLDECFLDLSGGPSMKAALADFPGLFLLRAFTKTYAMAALRLGYCLSADRALLAAMSRTAQPWNVSGPAQAAGIAALEDGAYLPALQELVRRERPRLAAGLAALGCRVCPGEANYLLFYCGVPDLPRKLGERGVLLRDCSNYHGLCPGWYRAAVRGAEENGAFLNIMKEVL